jgi:hypothetical protein
MWSFDTTMSAPSSAAMHSGVPNSMVATSAGKVSFRCGAASQVCVASIPWTSSSS